MSSCETRPTIRSRSGSRMSPPSMMGMTMMPSNVSQSCSVMITSCATSTRRRVRYPESAVLSAVSARPLRAPCVEMKYCSTVRPSRKFDVIGVSLISTDGFALPPHGDDLVVALAVGDRPFEVLLLDLYHLVARVLDQLPLVGGNDQVVDP